MKNLILCGGVGSRLWPLSRNLMPKQFYPLIEGESLFEKTVLRNRVFTDQYIIAVNSSQYFLAKNQLVDLGVDCYRGLLEPEGRNTAPAIALAAMAMDPDEILLVTPSDQLILNEKEYLRAVTRAKELAEEGFIVTLGIEAKSPETGFGYIEADGERVISFKEKPDFLTAESYIENGNYYWNSGIFCFKAGTFLDELKKLSPELYLKCLDTIKGLEKDIEIKPDPKLMSEIPSISVDYAVMEKSSIVKVVPCDLKWSDLGSFDSLYSQLTNSRDNNALLGADNEVLINSKRNLIMSGKRKIACVDIEDLIIIDSEDAILIAKRGSSQKVRDVVDELKKDSPYLLEAPITVKRPWGSYTVLENPDFYKTKRIEVRPGKRLSLQYHFKREEHWTFVKGVGKVRVGEKELVVERGSQVYIPLEAVHRVENTGDDTLIFIETQVGTYFGEDDIIRIEDDWGRI